jgi:hypothetical protein
MQQVISSGDVTSLVVTREAKTIYQVSEKGSLAISEEADSALNTAE